MKQLLVLLTLLASARPLPAESPNPYPPSPGEKKLVARWDFTNGTEGWTVERDVQLSERQGQMKLVTNPLDPILWSPRFEMEPGSVATITLRMRSNNSTPVQFFWSSDLKPLPSADRKTTFQLPKSDDWKIYQCEMSYEGRLQRLRFDPAMNDAELDIDWIQVETSRRSPLIIEYLTPSPKGLWAVIRNQTAARVSFKLNQVPQSIGANESKTFDVPSEQQESSLMMALTATVKVDGFPDQNRTAFVVNPQIEEDFLRLASRDVALEVTRDGRAARILKDKQPVAVIAPLVWQPGQQLPALNVQLRGNSLICTGGPVNRLTLSFQDGELHYELDAANDVEGPVVRALGRLEQGLLSGVEHLGKEEKSSSSVDIYGPEHIRYEPPYWHVTMPLMAYVTDRASIALAWKDPHLQPTFATPNFYDGTPDHRMSLKGNRISAAIHVGESFQDGGRLADLIAWAVRQAGGFPELPQTGMSAEQERNLAMTGLLNSALYVRGTWYHAIIPGHRTLPDRPQNFSDMASIRFRIDGTIPRAEGLVRKGGHICNDTAYFLTGQADRWLQEITKAAQDSLRTQQADGSFRYDGRLRKGHFENTSSGHCAQNVMPLLEHALATGDKNSLQGGLKTLEFMKRFRTPRGAQVWECPLHAPDLLAGARLMRAYLLGFRLTGNEEYRDLAVRWALTGVPYVYQWNDWPIQRYATIPTLCASNYGPTVWIGLPVQWVGISFADALLDLQPFDQTFDWQQLAHGMLVSGVQQEYKHAGMLADSIVLPEQRFRAPDINPCSLMTLRLRLEGVQDRPVTFLGEKHRVVSPFPLKFLGATHAEISAPEGVTYEIVIDGKTVRSIKSQGKDRVALE